jgi:Bacteriophage T4-like capsid assembly protein (Gp20).
MMEDALLIYRIARAPERRIFYIDVGNLTKGKAEEYLRGIMNNYRNKLVYDAETGELKDERKHLSMMEDFWLPRREGGRGTEISTLPGGQNLGEIEDIVYFQKKLYKSLNVPVGRLESENQFSLGRSTEISRDEVKFQKFLDRIRSKFSDVFMQALRTQLILKGIITREDWDSLSNDIVVDFAEDTYFSELKEAEMIRERINTLREVDEYVGKYYSVAYVRKHILNQTDDQIEDIDKQIEDEKEQYGDEDEDFE